MMTKTKSPTLEQLEAEHRDIYEKFRPTLGQYQEMAKRLLELQIEIFRRKLTEAALGVPIIDLTLVCSVSARETVVAFGQVLARLEKEQIKVTSVIYDPRTFMFHLYSKLQ